MTRKDETGKRYGMWTVIGRSQDPRKASHWLCVCDCGNTGLADGRYLRDGHSTRCAACVTLERQAACIARRKSNSDTTYGNVHDRLRKIRGSAKKHLCIKCGKTARSWAYLGGDPDERVGPGTPGRGGKTYMMAFTPNLDAYVPMCRSCHYWHDWRPDWKVGQSPGSRGNRRSKRGPA